MKKFEEKILIDIFKDEELDVFGIFKKRKQTAKKDAQNKNLMKYYKTSVKKLIDCYGKEGAIHYLQVLFKEGSQFHGKVSG